MNTQERRRLGELDNLCRQNRTRELWNKIHLSKGANNQNQIVEYLLPNWKSIFRSNLKSPCQNLNI